MTPWLSLPSTWSAGLRCVDHRVPVALAASAQLGLPAAAASLGLQAGVLTPALAAALVGAALLSLIPATIGSFRLSLDAATRPTIGAPVPGAAP